jgi:ubiquinone/menaquinone biosynthesis C-methylase UbiE
MYFLKHFTEYINRQYQNPKGLLGLIIGEKMVIQHQPETLWTIEQMKLKKDEIILELGCGAGYAMKKLLDYPSIYQVIGLDISRSILHSARIRNRREINKGRAKLVQSDVSSLPFQNEFFTKIYSIQSVYFWDNFPSTIAEIYRVLKPKGRIFITLSNGENEKSWEEVEVLLESQLLPIMKKEGFNNVNLLKGPNSRQYHTVTVLGEK